MGITPIESTRLVWERIIEFVKIPVEEGESLFPRLIGTGNLFSALALFEAYCLKLGKLIEQQANCQMHDVKGQGISRIFKFYSMAGIDYKALRFYEQLDCALRIRNCLIHAEGLLSWSREESALRKIVRDRTYLQVEMRAKAAERKSRACEVTIVDDGVGDRIKITNDYAFDVVWYAKNYVIAAAEAAHFSKLTKSDLQI